MGFTEETGNQDNSPRSGDNIVMEEEIATAEADAPAAPEGAPPEAGVAEDAPEQVLQAKVAELEDRLLRVHADFDNFRRRTRQEKDELLNYASAKLVGDLLPALDNFALALQAAETQADAASIAKGVDMVYKQLVVLLENMGLRAMEPVGQAFDPNLHEAVMSGPSEGQEPGVVTAVLRKGFYFKDKVLRPAMVKVSE